MLHTNVPVESVNVHARYVHTTLVVVMQVLFMASGKPTTSFRKLLEEGILSLIAKPYVVLVIKIPGVTEAEHLI